MLTKNHLPKIASTNKQTFPLTWRKEDKQMHRSTLLVLLFVTLQIAWTELSVNYYFDRLVKYGIDQDDTLASHVISRILKRVKHTNWKDVIIDLDMNLSEREKVRIMRNWERVFKRVDSNSEIIRRGRGYEGIPDHYHQRYKRAFRVIEGIILLARLGTARDYFKLNSFFTITFDKLDQVPGLRRQSRILLLQIHMAAKNLADS